MDLPFRDRWEAGRGLGEVLAGVLEPGAKPLVLALPRGGLPVAAEVAARLGAELEVVLVRKLGVPWQPELAMGALAEQTLYRNEVVLKQLGITREQVEAVAAREGREIERRQKLYRGEGEAPDLRGRVVVIVDDGLATGSTMLAAIRHVRQQGAERIIAAVPVAAREACGRVGAEADECVCLAQPEWFGAVGEWYEDFGQVSDEEAQGILAGARKGESAG